MPDYKKYFKFNATPSDVYAALTNPMAIQLWSGEEAIMSTEVGSEFEIFGGTISGRNIDFEENVKMVQEWYFGDEIEEASIVTIKLHEETYGTSLELKHTHIPHEDYKDMVEGWNEVYIAGLLEFFEEDL